MVISLAQSFGIFFAHLIGSLISWQRTALVCITFSFISLCLTIYSPESPSYLAARGRYDDCRNSFRWLRGVEEEDELKEMIEARRALKKSEVETNKFKDIVLTVKKKEFYKPIIIMVHAYAMVECAGGTTMASYSTVIIGLVLGTTANVNFWMITLDIQRIISNSIAVYVINRSKRRVCLFSIGTLSVLTHLTIAAYVYCATNNILPFENMWVPVILINLQIFTVATGMVPLPSVIAGEVFPLQYRSVGGSISIVPIATVTFTVLKSFPGLVDSVGLSGTYFIYAGALTYFLTVIWFFLPETKGKTLQQIEDEFRGQKLTEDDVEAIETLEGDKVTKVKDET